MDSRRDPAAVAMVSGRRGELPADHWSAGCGLVRTAAAAGAARSRAFVDGRRHLDDDGDVWRSLLFGAPPLRV
jgi:hypothetical protein